MCTHLGNEASVGQVPHAWSMHGKFWRIWRVHTLLSMSMEIRRVGWHRQIYIFKQQFLKHFEEKLNERENADAESRWKSVERDKTTNEEGLSRELVWLVSQIRFLMNSFWNLGVFQSNVSGLIHFLWFSSLLLLPLPSSNHLLYRSLPGMCKRTLMLIYLGLVLTHVISWC